MHARGVSVEVRQDVFDSGKRIVTRSGSEDRRENALLVGLNILSGAAVAVRELAMPLTDWLSLEAPRRDSSHSSIAVLNVRGPPGPMRTADDQNL